MCGGHACGARNSDTLNAYRMERRAPRLASSTAPRATARSAPQRATAQRAGTLDPHRLRYYSTQVWATPTLAPLAGSSASGWQDKVTHTVWLGPLGQTPDAGGTRCRVFRWSEPTGSGIGRATAELPGSLTHTGLYQR